MITLKNGCSYSGLTVTPSNWNTSKASVNDMWYVSYRYYDPNYPQPKRKKIKGSINKYKTLAERRIVVEAILETEKDLIEKQGYNPFANARIITPISQECIIDPITPFLKALDLAFNRINRAKSTKSDIKSVLTGVKKAASYCQIESFPITIIKRKHIILLLDTCSKINPNWSNNRFNKYKAYLGILFNELVMIEAIEQSPMSNIPKKPVVKKIRQTLTMNERKEVHSFLKDNYYSFWRFMVLFFHSGARESEFMRIKKEDIQLDQYYVIMTILKGGEPKEVKKTIKDLALNLWGELYNMANSGEFIFSKNLNPGTIQISERQITRRWKEHVKKKLGITADFYSLKHSNLDEITAIASGLDAAKFASHTSERMVEQVYAIGQEAREIDRLRKMNNGFV